MLVSYKLLQMENVVTCRLEEHMLGNQVIFGSRNGLLTPSDIQESIILNITSKIRKKFESDDKNGLVKYIDSLLHQCSNYDFDKIPGFLENGIPGIFLNVLNRNDPELNNAIFSLIVKFSSYPEIFQSFLTHDYTEFIINYIKNTKLEDIQYNSILYLKSILLFSTDQYLSQLLIEESIITFICKCAKNTNDASFIDLCFDILLLLSLIHLEKVHVAEIFDLINFILYGKFSRQVIIVKIFQILNNLFISDSIIFELFEENGFIELIQGNLNKPIDATTYYSCLLIYYIYTKMSCNYQFYMRKLFQIVISEESNDPIVEKCSLAASDALYAQLQAMPHLSKLLLNDDSFNKLFQAAQRKNLVTKISIMKILYCLIHESTNATFRNILEISNQKQQKKSKQQKSAIFQFIAEMADGNNSSLQISVKMLILIFEKSILFKLFDRCKSDFFKSFTNDFFAIEDSLEDEETIKYFQKLRNYLPS